jgi:hypothetical protein
MKITESKIRRIIREELRFSLLERIDPRDVETASSQPVSKDRDGESEEGGVAAIIPRDGDDEGTSEEPESFQDAFEKAREEGMEEFEYKGKRYHTKTEEELSAEESENQSPGDAKAPPPTEAPRTDADYQAQRLDPDNPVPVLYKDKHAIAPEERSSVRLKKTTGLFQDNSLCLDYPPIYEDTREEVPEWESVEFYRVWYVNGEPRPDMQPSLEDLASGVRLSDRSEFRWFEIGSDRWVINNPRCGEITQGWEDTVIDDSEYWRDMRNEIIDFIDIGVLLPVGLVLSTTLLGDILVDTGSAGLMLLKDPPDYESAAIIMAVTATIVGSGVVVNRLRKARSAGATVLDDALESGADVTGREFTENMSRYSSPEDIAAGQDGARHYLDAAESEIRRFLDSQTVTDASDIAARAKNDAMGALSRIDNLFTQGQRTKLAHYTSPESLSEFGVEITDFIRKRGKPIPSAEGTVFWAKSDEFGDVVVKIMDKELGMQKDALDAARWIYKHRDSLPPELSKHLPEIHKMGIVKDINGNPRHYMIVGKLDEVPLHAPHGEKGPWQSVIRSSIKPDDIFRNIYSDPDKLYSFSTKYGRGFKNQKQIDNLPDIEKTPATDDFFKSIGKDPRANFGTDIISYSFPGGMSKAPADVRAALQNVDWNAFSLKMLKINQEQTDFLMSVAASRVKRIDDAIELIETSKRSPGSIPKDVRENMSKLDLDMSLESLRRERSSLLDDISTVGHHVDEGKNLTSALENRPIPKHIRHTSQSLWDKILRRKKDYGPMGDFGKHSETPFDPELDSLTQAMGNLDKELARRGLFKADAHGKNIMMNPDTGDLVYVDVGFFRTEKPGTKIRYQGEDMTIIDPSTPLQQLQENINLERWQLLAGIN